VESLTIKLEEKVDTETIETIQKTLTAIQSTVRSEQVARKNSEKQMTQIKQAMTILYHKTQRKEKEVKVIREVTSTHHVKKSYKKEASEKLIGTMAHLKKVEASASAEILNVRSEIVSVQATMKAEAQARMKSDMMLQTLQSRTQTLFKKMSENEDKVANLEQKVTERLAALSSSLSELSVKATVSGDSSTQDLARMDLMLQTLVSDFKEEESARKIGDSQTQETMLGKIEVLIQSLISEATTSTEKTTIIKKTSKGGSTSTTKTSSSKTTKTVISGGSSSSKTSSSKTESKSVSEEELKKILGGGSSSSSTKTMSEDDLKKILEGGSSSSSKIVSSGGSDSEDLKKILEGTTSEEDLKKILEGGGTSSSSTTSSSTSSSSKTINGVPVSSSSDEEALKKILEGGGSSSSMNSEDFEHIKKGGSSGHEMPSPDEMKKILGGEVPEGFDPEDLTADDLEKILGSSSSSSLTQTRGREMF